MQVRSLATSSLSAAYSGSADAATTKPAAPADDRSISEHVAAQDAQEPIRSASLTQGTLVDTYL